MTLGFWLLLGLGSCSVVLGAVGIQRGRAVALPPLNVARGEKPWAFWAGVGFQVLIGCACILAAVDEIIPFGFGQWLSAVAG
jgi:hypothetical protein